MIKSCSYPEESLSKLRVKSKVYEDKAYRGTVQWGQWEARQVEHFNGHCIKMTVDQGLKQDFKSSLLC